MLVLKVCWRHSEKPEGKCLLSVGQCQSYPMMLGQPVLPLQLESCRHPLGKDLSRWRSWVSVLERTLQRGAMGGLLEMNG